MLVIGSLGESCLQFLRPVSLPNKEICLHKLHHYLLASDCAHGKRSGESVNLLFQSTCTPKLQLHCVLLLVPRILSQDDKSFEDMSIWDILFRRQLRPLCRAQTHWRLVCLETRDRARFASLTDHVNSLDDVMSTTPTRFENSSRHT